MGQLGFFESAADSLPDDVETLQRLLRTRDSELARPLGGFEQAKAISLASFSPSKILGTAGAARGLRLNTASRPSSTSCLRTR